MFASIIRALHAELVAAWASATGRAKHNAAVAQLRRLQLLQVRRLPDGPLWSCDTSY